MSVNFLRPVPAQTFQLTMMIDAAPSGPGKYGAGRGAGAADRDDRHALGGWAGSIGTGSGLGTFDVGPRVWGLYEPAGAPWDRAALTAVIREHMPEETSAFVAGPGCGPR